jgi:hypothetical protein
MVKLKIDDQHYGFPERLPIALWSQIAQLDLEEPLQWPRALHLLTGAPLDALTRADHDSMDLGMRFLVNLMGMRKATTGLNFAEVQFGQWVDLDIWLTWGIDKHMADIIQILKPDCEWADEALWMIDSYTRWRLSMYKVYSALFGLNDPQGDDPHEHDRMHIPRGWYALMVRLAGGDLLKMEGVASQPVKAALNMLAYQKEEDLKEAARQLQISRKYELQRNSRSLR